MHAPAGTRNPPKGRKSHDTPEERAKLARSALFRQSQRKSAKEGNSKHNLKKRKGTRHGQRAAHKEQNARNDACNEGRSARTRGTQTQRNADAARVARTHKNSRPQRTKQHATNSAGPRTKKTTMTQQKRTGRRHSIACEKNTEHQEKEK
ncbi:hypothetical protein, conserved in T. vivax, (fragment), partial [Trypanosoma vivax Y486]